MSKKLIEIIASEMDRLGYGHHESHAESILHAIQSAAPAVERHADFWSWLDSAYREGSEGERPKFTKYNMEVAYQAGLNAAPAVERQEPVAYAVFADNGNIRCWSRTNTATGLLVAAEDGAEITPLYASPPAPVSADIAHDRAYRNGLMAGFQFGISGNENGYAHAIAKFNAEIHAAKAEQSAPVAVVLPDGYMIAERSIWTESQVESATKCIAMLKNVPGMTDRDLALAAMDAGQCKAPEIMLSDLACIDKFKELNQ